MAGLENKYLTVRVLAETTQLFLTIEGAPVNHSRTVTPEKLLQLPSASQQSTWL